MIKISHSKKGTVINKWNITSFRFQVSPSNLWFFHTFSANLTQRAMFVKFWPLSHASFEKKLDSGGITIPPGYYVLYYCGIMSKMYPKTWKRTLWKCIALWNCHNDHLRRISGEALNNWLVLEGLSHMNRIKDLFWNQIFYFQIVFWTNHLLYFNDICWQGKRRIVFLSAQQRQK